MKCKTDREVKKEITLATWLTSFLIQIISKNYKQNCEIETRGESPKEETDSKLGEKENQEKEKE